jgi:hypothetical protein
MARVASNSIQVPRKQRGFLAAGLGIAIFAVFSGIGAGVVANKEAASDGVAVIDRGKGGTQVAYTAD